VHKGEKGLLTREKIHIGRKMSEKTENLENGKEKPDWFDTLLALGVKSAKSEWFLYTVDLHEFSGDKVALIRGQEQRALAILQKIAQREFSGVQYQVDDHLVLWERKLLIDSADKMRESQMPFMRSDGSDKLFIYNDATLEKYAREAFNDLLFNADP